VANRDRHRQGLIYGPVRPSGPRDRGRIVGNLLGFLVVVVTVVVLALAIYFFVQARSTPVPPSATATPAATPATSVVGTAPEASASPIAIGTVAVTPSPVAVTPPPSTDPTPTPGPTLFIPPVASGPGFITFGTTADAELHVLDPKTTFGVSEPMIWRAYLTRPANSSELQIRIYKQDPTQPSGLALVREDPVQPDVNGVQIYFRRLRAIGAVAGTGLYTIEYVRGDEILAQGSFLVQ
jgi:hypothetical protein